MRALVIGFPLPDPQIDNYNFLSAPSFFDYDALVVDTASVSRAIEEVVSQSQERLTYTDEPVVNGPTSPGAVGPRSAGGGAIGVELAVGGGRVIFLPPVRSPKAGTDRYPIAECVVDCIRRLLGRAAAGPAPPWASRYALPGLAEREARLEEAERGGAGPQAPPARGHPPA